MEAITLLQYLMVEKLNLSRFDSQTSPLKSLNNFPVKTNSLMIDDCKASLQANVINLRMEKIFLINFIIRLG